MAAVSDDLDKMPVVRNLADFDKKSGNFLERLVFNNRLVMVIVCAIITLVLGYFAATKLVLNASQMIPQPATSRTNHVQKSLRAGERVAHVVEKTPTWRHL